MSFHGVSSMGQRTRLFACLTWQLGGPAPGDDKCQTVDTGQGVFILNFHIRPLLLGEAEVSERPRCFLEPVDGCARRSQRSDPRILAHCADVRGPRIAAIVDRCGHHDPQRADALCAGLARVPALPSVACRRSSAFTACDRRTLDILILDATYSYRPLRKTAPASRRAHLSSNAPRPSRRRTRRGRQRLPRRQVCSAVGGTMESTLVDQAARAIHIDRHGDHTPLPGIDCVLYEHTHTPGRQLRSMPRRGERRRSDHQ